MKQLARKPLLFAFLLTFPLWMAFGNFIVAAMVALLFASLIAMCLALYTIKQTAREAQRRDRNDL